MFIFRFKRSELKEKTRVLSSTRSFVDDLGVEINGLKSDRARLREDLEMKEITIQKVRSILLPAFEFFARSLLAVGSINLSVT